MTSKVMNKELYPNAGIGNKLDVVLEFETIAFFQKDRRTSNPKISDITLENSDWQNIPINVTIIKNVGFKKRKWKFW